MSGEAEKTERAYVYMVRCAGGQLYTGWTNDPASRLHAHKSGKGAKCTRALGAQRFAYLERCTDKSAALRREAALKKLTKAQKETLCAEWAEKNLPRLSLATRADAAEILDIYNWYVLHHTATFQVTPSSLPEYEDWVDSTRALIPLLLARDGDGKLLGYACAHRFHPRCGTSFLILVVIVSVFLYSVLPWSSTSLRVVFKLLLLPLVMGISYELLKWCGRSDNIATRIIRQPGIWVQHLTVFEPDDSMIEVAIAAVTPVLPEDPEDGRW